MSVTAYPLAQSNSPTRSVASLVAAGARCEYVSAVIELAVPPEEIEWRGGGAFRGLLSLPLRVS